MLLHPIDLTVLVVYFGLMLALGVYFSRTNNSTEQYFLGGRNFSGWVIGLSLVGTSISSITFLAYPGDAFKTNWLRFLPNLMLPIAVLIAAWHFLPKLRRDGSVTAYEFLEKRYGPAIRGYGAVAFIIAQITRVSMILYLISLVIQTITGLDAHLSVLVAGMFVAIYTILGGIEAVVWTDVIQTIVLISGGLFCITVIILQVPGGLPTIIETAWQADKLSVGDYSTSGYQPASWQPSLIEKTALMMLLIGLISWLTEYSSNQNTVQRFCASKSEQEARKAMFICALVSVPTWAFFMSLGTALWVFFQHFPSEAAAQVLDGSAKAEEILPHFITNYLPHGVIGLVIAAAIAAAMSSLDSSINAIATVTTHDLYRRFMKTDQEDRHYLNFARIVTTIAGVLMIVGALYLIETSTTTLQDLATVLTALLAGGLLTIYLIGFFSKRCNTIHIALGIAATMIYTVWTILSSRDVVNYPFDLYYTGLLGNVVMFVVAYGSSFVIRSKPEEVITP
ncbi:MAG: sodium:solute symporter [Pseudomonadales bacterium]|nr:sodium:solute symporter [Pseudomonadales bacterium]